MRIAFLTPEFPTTLPDAGGLASYLVRMTRLLALAGHAAEVFVLTHGRGERLVRDGVVVHHVPAPVASRWARLGERALRGFGRQRLVAMRRLHATSKVLVEAMEGVHERAPFDVVQGADYMAVSVALCKRPGRKHVVRCSSAWDLYSAVDGRQDLPTAAQIALEAQAVAEADIAYAPSALVANHYTQQLGRDVKVVRPPAFLEANPAARRPTWLPNRYLLHFAGTLGRRKGTWRVFEAMMKAVDDAPDLTLVCVGRADFGELRDRLRSLGPAAGNVVVVYPQEKPALYRAIVDAAGVVLPSLVDNLPNTVIESLLLGTPVIGSSGASIDELVLPGVSGVLIDPDDVDALADAMVRAWQGTLNLTAAPPWLETPAGAPFRPEAALANFLDLVG